MYCLVISMYLKVGIQLNIKIILDYSVLISVGLFVMQFPILHLNY